MSRAELLNQYRINMEAVVTYGPSDIRGIAAMNMIRQILHFFEPNDVDIANIDRAVLLNNISRISSMHNHQKEGE